MNFNYDPQAAFPQPQFFGQQIVPMQQIVPLQQVSNSYVHELENPQKALCVENLPDVVLPMGKNMYLMKAKASGGIVRKIFAEFIFHDIFEITYTGRKPEDIMAVYYHIGIITSGGKQLEFHLTKDEVMSDKLCKVVQERSQQYIFFKGKQSECSDHIRNLLLYEAEKNKTHILPFYAGFYTDETQQLQYAYGQARQIDTAIHISKFLENSEGSNVGNSFRYVSNVYEHITSSKTRNMFFLLLHGCVISSLIESKFDKNMPRVLVNCSSSRDSQYVNSLLGGIFDIVQPDDKSLPKKLQEMKDGAALINFAPEYSKYLNTRRYEYVVSLLEGKEDENINDAEIILINVKNAVSFPDELIVKIPFSFDSWELDPTAIGKNIQIHLKMFINWIIKRYPHGMEKELEKWPYTNFRGKWSFVSRIVQEFYEKMKENLPNFMYRSDMYLAQLMDIDSMDDFNNDLNCIQKGISEEIVNGSIRLISQRHQRSFLVESKRGYLNNIYLCEDCLYINNRFFKDLLKKYVGYSRFGDFLKGMQDSGILLDTELINQGRSQKISIFCREANTPIRLNVWRFSRELLPHEIMELL